MQKETIRPLPIPLHKSIHVFHSGKIEEIVFLHPNVIPFLQRQSGFIFADLPDHALGQGHTLSFSGFLVYLGVLKPDNLVCVDLLAISNEGIGFVHIQRIHMSSKKGFNDQCDGVS